MPALVVEERRLAAAWQEAHAVDRPGCREERGVERDLARPYRVARALDAEEPRRRAVDLVARLRVVQGPQLRLQLVLGRGLDDVHGARRRALHLEREHRVARGRDPVGVVGVARGAVGGAEELDAFGAEDEVRAVARDLVRGQRGLGLRLARAVAVGLLLAIERVDGLGPRRRRVADRDRAVDIARHDMAEVAARRRAHEPRVPAEGVLATRRACIDAAVRALVRRAVDPEELDRLAEAVHELEVHRGALPTAAALAWRERGLEQDARSGVAFSDHAPAERADDGLVAALERERHAFARHRHAAHGKAARRVGRAEELRNRRVVEERAPRVGAVLCCVAQPPLPRAVARCFSKPAARPVDPGARPDGVVVLRGLGRDAGARGVDRRAGRIERRVGRCAGRRVERAARHGRRGGERKRCGDGEGADHPRSLWRGVAAARRAQRFGCMSPYRIQPMAARSASLQRSSHM
ncbi:MAG: hypothetical protein LW636_01710 [Planctomycetaceae bacterium]|nr:hypothetical protein [Planctomycetaceae bacterium]